MPTPPDIVYKVPVESESRKWQLASQVRVPDE